MNIEDILKDKQPEVLKKLNKNKKRKRKRYKKKKENLSERDIEELMSHSFFRRGKHGLKQVK